MRIFLIKFINDYEAGIFRNEYEYDDNHRITFMNNTIFKGTEKFEDVYSTSYKYDAIGNIKELTRKGFLGIDTDGNPLFEEIYNMGYTITNSRLMRVVDAPTGSNDDLGFNASGSIIYDAGGNIRQMPGKAIENIEYNIPNMPTEVDFGNGNKIKNNYTFAGERLRKEIIGSESDKKYYIGPIEFSIDEPKVNYMIGNGRLVGTIDGWEIQYKNIDHLGNTTSLFTEEIDVSTGEGSGNVEVLQKHMYYPFGMEMDGTWNTNLQDDFEDPNHDFRYNGKELDQDYGLDWYAYGFRWYDPAIGRFTGVDPISDQFPHVSTYNYAENEPVGHIDLWGLQKYKVDGVLTHEDPKTRKDGSVNPDNDVVIDVSQQTARVNDYNTNATRQENTNVSSVNLEVQTISSKENSQGGWAIESPNKEGPQVGSLPNAEEYQFVEEQASGFKARAGRWRVIIRRWQLHTY